VIIRYAAPASPERVVNSELLALTVAQIARG
jgi:hypothetical protein